MEGCDKIKEEGWAKQEALSPQHESELVEYIDRLASRGLRHARYTTRNPPQLSSTLVSREWVTRFIERNKIDLVSKQTTGE
jgi:hypothetical protein